MTKQLDKIKEFLGNLPGGLKKALIFGGGGLLVFAVVVAFLLNKKEPDSYETLFSGLSTQEASEVMVRLQESNIDYQFQPDGQIKVPTAVVDKTRATLAVAGYPKNGFAYETYLNNTNMMSTESDKKSLKVWAMQDQLAATIRCIDGVKDATVSISPGENQKYVLDNNAATIPTASVMITMRDGGTPSSDTVMGIQRLVAKSVANMDLGDVAVIDSSGLDVSVRKNDAQSPASDAKVDFEKRVQMEVESNILNVLGPMYGWSNVKVSAKCEANMQKTLSEESGYTAPNPQQNTGLISRQTLTNDNSGGTGGGGVPGADANANIPQYNNQVGNGQSSSSSSSDTEYELNQKKTQSQNDSATVSNLTVAISINAASLGAAEPSLLSLIGNASGIPQNDWATKITIVNSEWAKAPVELADNPTEQPVVNNKPAVVTVPPYAILAAIAGGVLFLILLIVFILHRRKKSARELEAMMEDAVLSDLGRAGLSEPKIPIPVITEEDERSKEMKNNIRDFTLDNPEISAQLLKSWLRGDEEHG